MAINLDDQRIIEFDVRTDEMLVNMGPQHPSTHGVLRLVLQLAGESVVGADTTIGYLHTGIEKTAEQKKWQQVIPLVERMDYLAAQSNSLAFCLSVERLLGVEMPERVQNIRVLLAELQRLNSHLVWLATHGLEIGAVSVMMYCFREREQLLNINEMIAGFRMFPSYIRIGGLREDLPPGFHEAVSSFLDAFPSKLDEYEALLTRNQIWLKRTRNVGIIGKEDAVAYGLVGPIARAAGVPYDVRKAFPYLGYETYDFMVPTGTIGDVYDRYLVRIEEFRQSLRIIRQAIEGLPEGPIVGKVPRLIKPPAGETYHAIESPKGELGYFIVSDGKSTNPYRFRVRPPSFCNLQALPRLVRGHLVADVVALIGSIDIVLGEVDR